MNNINRLRLTWISFFSYGLTGALVIVTGVVLGNIAEYFKVPISAMSATFTFLNSGILLSIFLNAWLMEIIALKKQLIFGFVLMILAVLGLMSGQNLTVFSLSMFILGVVSGITMSIGTYLITYLYTGRQRGSRLLFTDSFFSMAGALFPILAGVFLAHHIPWYWVYAAIGSLYVAIFVLTLFSDFPVLGSKQPPQERTAVTPQKEKWGIGVLLISLAALCYILGQLGFISWVPEYATKNFGMGIEEAGSLVGNFWTAYMVGMWVFSALLRFVDLQRVVTILAGLSMVIMYLFIAAEQGEYLHYYLFGLGFISSAIYTTLITLGSQQTRVTSPKLVNFILTCGTVGTMLTFVVTGPIVAHFGVKAALSTSNLLYLAVFILCLLLGWVTRHRMHGHTASEPAADKTISTLSRPSGD
ncbi:MFS transporter TsgA [Acerihabitans sp. TG2]|uniref:MFS transporter TsgA n=1 Tax=Acerihabitans sp. TG2 TaxID=3096008 RepID=UPI002B22CE33|nr:MFS transporter TsgA [Acerihabitans sp. TG2]MEA9390883.1 MFS transporter TsgA [Acerihabitans sp. TG2]